MNLNTMISNLDIKHENLNVLCSDVKTIKITDINALEQFYISNKEYADMVTVDDEFVGLTYSNLEFLKSFINLEKTNQKVLRI